MSWELYLIYLAAVAVFFASPPDTSQLLIISNSIRHGVRRSVGPTASASAFLLFRQGFVTSMANPFAVVFFAALFPQFIDQASPVLPQLLILGVTYLLVDGIILVAWGWLGTRAASGLKHLSLDLVNKICGTLMIAAAGLLAMKDFEPQPQHRTP